MTSTSLRWRPGYFTPLYEGRDCTPSISLVPASDPAPVYYVEETHAGPDIEQAQRLHEVLDEAEISVRSLLQALAEIDPARVIDLLTDVLDDIHAAERIDLQALRINPVAEVSFEIELEEVTQGKPSIRGEER